MIVDFQPYPVYKPSGLEWLADIPAHWGVARISRVARDSKDSFTDGDWVELPYITDNGIRLIQTGNVGIGKYREQGFRYIDPLSFEELNCTEVFPGDILICRLADPVGRACLAPNLGVRMITSVDVCILKPSEQFSAEFIVFLLSSKRYLGYVTSIARGSTRSRISRSMLGAIKIPSPPLPEQHAIARYLDHADRRIQRYIQAKEKLITLLHEARQATIQRAVTRGLNPDVPLKPSGVDWLGDVPAHWEVRRLRYLIEGNLTYGANAAAEHDNPNWPRYLRITDFALDGTLRDDTFRSLPPEVARDYLVKPGDLLLARSGATVGKAFLVTSEVGQACHAGYLIRARPRSCLVEPRFLFAFTQSAMFTRWKDSTFIIATIPNISAEKYANLSVPTPPLEEQKQIAAHLNKATAAIDTAIDAARRQTEHMQEYRASLIAHVVTGKLDVRAAAERIGMATS